ncbi:MAG: bifunctional methionine sulfoxide reductase B/A protein [Prevotellaceae bacterium]|nr:bifunctional methionine sulfoxide reductase B/A protein [Prevotellaceae bacterium]
MKHLTDFEKHVILNKGTEAPFSGEYCKFHGAGTYLCKQCGTPLYRSTDKFNSGCGWPSFDDEIQGAVRRTTDADGSRTEITCAHCGGHLGHVFEGEGFTPKNTRHCVNSVSLTFVPEVGETPTKTGTQTAIFGGGCFWGVEYMMQQQSGVLSVQSGYMGGHVIRPTYRQVCTGKTGHAEVVKVDFDPAVVSYETLAKLFLEIHDPTQKDRQGPDIGNQYRSVIFYTTEEQRQTAEKLVDELKKNGYRIVTQIERAGTFWPAEDYHQNYYENKGTTPYCHVYTKRF